MPSRRMILTTAGAGAIVLIASATGWAWAPGTRQATAPWRQAGDSFGDPRLDALAYAILAPNPHNRQPWIFELIGDDQIAIRCDLDRRLPETDPPDRQITIGFGAMLELLAMAAAEKGYAVTIDLFPEGEPQPRLDQRPLAIVSFRKDSDVKRNPLFSEALNRRTTRAAFDANHPVSGDTLNMVTAAAIHGSSADGTIDTDRRARLIDLVRRGWTVEYETEDTRRESIKLMRIGNREIDNNPDGVALGGTMMGLFKMAGAITPEALDTPGTTAYEQGLSQYISLIESAQGFVWLTSETNTRRDQIAAGRDWMRCSLAAQKAGLAVQPLSQTLQEFPQMAALYMATQAELGVSAPGVVQMLARVGYAAFPTPSPRWPLTSHLVEAGA